MAIGVIEGTTPVPMLDLVFSEIDLQGSMAFDVHDFELALDFLAQGRINTDLFLSDVIPLEEIEERGFKRLLSTPDVVKIQVRP